MKKILHDAGGNAGSTPLRKKCTLGHRSILGESGLNGKRRRRWCAEKSKAICSDAC
jgi:hypothetical protein